MKAYLEKLACGADLSMEETRCVFDRIMAGELTPAQIGAFIMALRMKGETAGEIAGAAESMRRHAVFVDTGGVPVVDTCGTGGDNLNTFNISTAAAFVVAGAGVPVAKHGNRAVSSKCGSADVLAALGVNIECSVDVVEECIHSSGIGFLFAPKLHPAMKYAVGPRKELGIRTIFNMLGPLTNPAGASGQVIGVFAPDLTEPFAHVLKRLGCRRAFVVHGRDGMDEITVTTTSRVTELRDGVITTSELDPARYFEGYHSLDDLMGGDPDVNAGIVRWLLNGEKGAPRDVVAINAAAAIVAGNKAESINDGLEMALESIDSGAAASVLDKFVAETN